MARCDYCDTLILFGGVEDYGVKFCNNECHERGYLKYISERFPNQMVQEAVNNLHQGSCPKCEGPGPINVHKSHKVWSAVLLTTWKSDVQLSCRSCGIKSQLLSSIYSMTLGWWGLPWGLLMTPIQLVRNLMLLMTPEKLGPTPQMEKMVRMSMAKQMVES